MNDVCMCEQIADFGMSRVLENNMTHVSTNTHGESDHTLLCSLKIQSSQSCHKTTSTTLQLRPEGSGL